MSQNPREIQFLNPMKSAEFPNLYSSWMMLNVVYIPYHDIIP